MSIEEDEAFLLQSSGIELLDATNYENQVILNTVAPSLSLYSNNNNNVTPGLPDLSQLVNKKLVGEDEAASVVKLLEKCRSELRVLTKSKDTTKTLSCRAESHEEIKLHMKIQILMSHLESKCTPDQLEYYTGGYVNELAEERKRLMRCLSYATYNNIHDVDATKTGHIGDQSTSSLRMINRKKRIEHSSKYTALEKKSRGRKEEESTSSSSSSSVKKISCPVCNKSFTVSIKEGEDIDSLLVNHITHCQSGRTRSVATSEYNFGASPNSTSQSPKRRRLTKLKDVKHCTKIRIPSEDHIDDLEEWYYNERVEEWFTNGIANMATMSEHVDENPPGTEILSGGLIIPSWINDRLFGYQRDGLHWMNELHLQGAGGIVGDEMGLGKTVQVCSFLGAMATCCKLDSVLIIAPATMMTHWLREIKVWAPGLRRILLHNSGENGKFRRKASLHFFDKLDKWLKKERKMGIDEDCGPGYVVVTTYEQVREIADIYTSHYWSYVVLDEGQKIKNPDIDLTLACKRLRTPHRLLLSGTPIQNNLRELWSLFDFVFPGRLGTLPAFEVEFSDPIRRGGYANASRMQVQLAYKSALVLRDLINPFLLRRLKKDVKEVQRMPGKTEQVLFCKLTHRQRSLYEAYIRSSEVQNVLRGSAQCFKAITFLRKLVNHPDLVCEPDEKAYESFILNGCSEGLDLDEDSECGSVTDISKLDDEMADRAGKFQVLAKILPLWYEGGHRVLIFSQTRKMLDLIQKFVMLKGWKYGRIDGTTNVGSRQKLVDDFNNDTSYFIMLLTTRTGGVGLNLIGADRIIQYDPDWNPQTDAQARERSWRFGQKRHVTVYRLITKGTIEEKIYHRQIFKTALTNQILQDPKQRRLFTQKDLRDLFSLKADKVSEDDIDELPKTEYVEDNGKAASDKENRAKSSDELIHDTLRSKGLAGIFDEDLEIDTSTSKSKSSREMEEEAERIAREAARALKKSVIGSQQVDLPTWTGRFGGNNSNNDDNLQKSKSSFGGSATVGVKGPFSSLSSSSLLNNIRQKKNQEQSAGEFKSVTNSTKKYSKLLMKIKVFIESEKPTTDQLLDKFSDIPDKDAAIFKSLLNRVAYRQKGRWFMKDE